VLQVQPRLTADLGLDLNPQSRAVKPVAALTYQVGMSYLALHGVLAVTCLHTALQKPGEALAAVSTLSLFCLTIDGGHTACPLQLLAE
jgi:hypothetical protein